ncbi:class I SAM-dependent methyltransferase [Paenibacillus humicola]|uniref:class I SAM-dependent methyltransferase n=1 Tax=Paenibacillus humicola TaxID=3110540 RepID=UPI00237A3ABF|nr:class I SAM-dependent methyltransferase [Paenibacillus humicola]
MDSKVRFSNRAQLYVKYRPSYPAALVDALYQRAGLEPAACTIADVGAGTGIFTRLLLERGSRVYAVEPNPEMRGEAEAALGEFERFTPVEGSAERTTLSAGSVDCVVSAQAFHWFEPVQTRQEFSRILKPEGTAALVWNKRIVEGDPFSKAYDELILEFAADYNEVKHTRLGEEQFRSFFRGGEYRLGTFANEQRFDFDGLLGRSASSSYVPLPGSAEYEPFVAKLKKLFERFETDGHVYFRYESELYTGKV